MAKDWWTDAIKIGSRSNRENQLGKSKRKNEKQEKEKKENMKKAIILAVQKLVKLAPSIAIKQ